MWMDEGRQEDDWLKLSHVLAKIHNSFVSKKSQAVKPSELNPFAAVREQEALSAWADEVDDDNLAVGRITF